MKVTTLAPWFGSARTNAARIGEVIGKQAWVGIPFAGGCCEVPHIRARSIAVNDKHCHLINLARCVAHKEAFEVLSGFVTKLLVHPAELESAREYLRSSVVSQHDINPNAAAAYFASCWISRSNAGTSGELDQPLATRFTASGGSSVRRYRSAVDALPEWHEVLKDRCEFTCLDWQEFLDKCHDREGHCLYVDPPWMDAGEEYLHTFTEADHCELAERLVSFVNAKVVIRHSDHPLYRDLYPDWKWVDIGGRNQGNNSISECLIANGQ